MAEIAQGTEFVLLVPFAELPQTMVEELQKRIPNTVLTVHTMKDDDPVPDGSFPFLDLQQSLSIKRNFQLGNKADAEPRYFATHDNIGDVDVHA